MMYICNTFVINLSSGTKLQWNYIIFGKKLMFNIKQ